MDTRKTMVHMLRQLLKEMEIVSSQGAGYYTCVPFAHRFNRLLEQSRRLFPETSGFLETFDPIEATDPKDPADKSKALLGIRIEVSQLIALLESTGEEPVR
ncbi:MAG TPA: hypothetical protein ENN65_07390 [Candidatus Hydrogenedentes bacterium]|nr:hypothetical protein [Candidatus Hydrogenedentota bacterium]